jgi:hypothetical protein
MRIKVLCCLLCTALALGQTATAQTSPKQQTGSWWRQFAPGAFPYTKDAGKLPLISVKVRESAGWCGVSIPSGVQRSSATGIIRSRLRESSPKRRCTESRINRNRFKYQVRIILRGKITGSQLQVQPVPPDMRQCGALCLRDSFLQVLHQVLLI